ncbi:hypothetical protein [Sphingomonas sp.]|uniref:hypothetical protein n=1 Tax=Sphingomonas sp. TaxID=28214 RepID=UPI0025F48644|nr:hypothetical protein [Sphingomonas sp.]
MALAGLLPAAPASAQFFIKSPDLKGEPVTGAEPGMIGQELPGATPLELRAALVWNLRAALNVAALQCDFEPTLLTRDNYNAIIVDHAGELKSSYSTLEKYFTRINKNNKKLGLTELDRFGTRVYSGFSTVSGQLTFCSAAGSIAHEALFAPRGKFGDLAEARMRELRASLAPWGEQAFPRRFNRPPPPAMRTPPWNDETCWKDSDYQIKKCGAPAWDGAPVIVVPDDGKKKKRRD